MIIRWTNLWNSSANCIQNLIRILIHSQQLVSPVDESAWDASNQNYSCCLNLFSYKLQRQPEILCECVSWVPARHCPFKHRQIAQEWWDQVFPATRIVQEWIRCRPSPMCTRSGSCYTSPSVFNRARLHELLPFEAELSSARVRFKLGSDFLCFVKQFLELNWKIQTEPEFVLETLFCLSSLALLNACPSVHRERNVGCVGM